MGQKEIDRKPGHAHQPQRGTPAKADLRTLPGAKTEPSKGLELLGLEKVEHDILPGKSGCKEKRRNKANLLCNIPRERKRLAKGPGRHVQILEYNCENSW